MAKVSAYPQQPTAAVHFHHLPKCPTHIHPSATNSSALPARCCSTTAQPPAADDMTSVHRDTHACSDICAASAVAPRDSTRDTRNHKRQQQLHEQQQTEHELIDCKHWLEVHDEHHRYGTFLRAYYDVWTNSGSDEPFFLWLDEGDGRMLRSVPGTGGANKTTPVRDVTRGMLDSSRVHYCTWGESECYEVHRRGDGRLVWGSTTPKAPGATPHGVVDTTHDDERWIFVVDELGRLLVNRKVKAHFHHSSFVAGRAVRAAGRISVRDGVVAAVSPNSGHYRTTREHLAAVVHDVLGSDIVVTELSADAPTES